VGSYNWGNCGPQRLERGEIRERDLFNATLRKVMRERLTYKYLVKGEEMTPTFASEGENVLVRAITSPSARCVSRVAFC
jgi:hypothetical protein